MFASDVYGPSLVYEGVCVRRWRRLFIVTCKGNHYPGACSTSIAPKSGSVYLDAESNPQVGTVRSIYGSQNRRLRMHIRRRRHTKVPPSVIIIVHSSRDTKRLKRTPLRRGCLVRVM